MADNRNLYNILGDLWGSSDALAAENARKLQELTRELNETGTLDTTAVDLDAYLTAMQRAAANAPTAAAAPAKQPAPCAQPAVQEDKKEPEKPSFPPFEEFWKLADEAIDWTDALSYAQPQEEGMDPELWSFLHEHAAKVLEGDLPTYLEVLRKSNPLGNVRPYAKAFNVHAESADRLSVSFEGLAEYLEGEEDADRRYLAGISLRCARDLMAALPVREVAVTARVDGESALKVAFTRNELLKVRFSFVDPVEFAHRCGGLFAGEEAPAEEVTPAEEPAPVEAAAPAEEPAPVEDAAPAEVKPKRKSTRKKQEG